MSAFKRYDNLMERRTATLGLWIVNGRFVPRSNPPVVWRAF